LAAGVFAAEQGEAGGKAGQTGFGQRAGSRAARKIMLARMKNQGGWRMRLHLLASIGVAMGVTVAGPALADPAPAAGPAALAAARAAGEHLFAARCAT